METFTTNLNFKELIFLFLCGFVIGATVNFISKTDEIEPIAFHSKPETLIPIDSIDNVKILCLVLTTEPFHKERAIHVKNTWGAHCNKLIFASNATDAELGSVNLQENDSYDTLWGKTKHAMTYAYENFYADYDWFYKADDNSYAILDNMRFVLAAYFPNDPIYFGKKFRFHKFGRFSGGAGYVMSREALKRFVTEALPDEEKCKREDTGAEDLELGKCMEHIGVYPGDARDRFHRERFLPFVPEQHLFPDRGLAWYWQALYYFNDEGLDCCSNYTTSFHYIEGKYMYFLEYVIFNLQAYGVRHVYDSMPARSEFRSVVQKLRADAKNLRSK